MTPYPTTVDIPTYLNDAIAFLRGTGNKAALFHDSWEVAGYAGGKFFPVLMTGPETMKFASPALPDDDNALAQMIEDKLSETSKMAQFNWDAWLNFALQIAQRVIAKLLLGT
jgi:hypothetical protein